MAELTLQQAIDTLWYAGRSRDGETPFYKENARILWYTLIMIRNSGLSSQIPACLSNEIDIIVDWIRVEWGENPRPYPEHDYSIKGESGIDDWTMDFAIEFFTDFSRFDPIEFPLAIDANVLQLALRALKAIERGNKIPPCARNEVNELATKISVYIANLDSVSLPSKVG